MHGVQNRTRENIDCLLMVETALYRGNSINLPIHVSTTWCSVAGVNEVGQRAPVMGGGTNSLINRPKGAANPRLVERIFPCNEFPLCSTW